MTKEQVVFSLTAAAKFDILNQYEGRSGKFIKGFLLNDKRNKNGWRVDWETCKKYATDFINKPGTYMEVNGVPDHPNGSTYIENLSNQEKHRVVNIIEVQIDEEKRQLNYVGEILSPELSGIHFEKMLKKGLINYTSPGIWPEVFKIMGLTEDGRQALDVFKFRALHFSYINDPAYGKDTAHTIGTCDGDGVTCSRQLAAKLLGVNENLEHLQEIPLMNKDLKITPCNINSIWSKDEQKEVHENMIAGDTCVGTKLKIIKADNPEMELNQQLAIAYSYCEESDLKSLHQDLQNNKKVKVSII